MSQGEAEGAEEQQQKQQQQQQQQQDRDQQEQYEMRVGGSDQQEEVERAKEERPLQHAEPRQEEAEQLLEVALDVFFRRRVQPVD